MRTSNFTSD